MLALAVESPPPPAGGGHGRAPFTGDGARAGAATAVPRMAASLARLVRGRARARVSVGIGARARARGGVGVRVRVRVLARQSGCGSSDI